MSKIGCQVCLDLIPLVKDGIASKESCDMVEAHIKSCESCRAVYEDIVKEEVHLDDQAMVKKIQKQLFLGAVGIMFLGAVLGMALSGSMNMFYNILIMPALGGIGYLALGKKSYMGIISLFLFSGGWIFIREVISGSLAYDTLYGILSMAAIGAGAYTFLFILGLLISFLLKYAFKRENHKIDRRN